MTNKREEYNNLFREVLVATTKEEMTIADDELWSWIEKYRDKAVEEKDKELVENYKQIEGLHQGYREEIRHLRETFPARGKPVIRIKSGNTFYIPTITKALDSPDGLYIEAELQSFINSNQK